MSGRPHKARLLKNAGGRMDKEVFLMLLYLAEREALRRWGRPICGGEIQLREVPTCPGVERSDSVDLKRSAYVDEILRRLKCPKQ